MYYRVRFILKNGLTHYPGIDFDTEMEALDYANESVETGGHQKAIIYSDGVDNLEVTA